MPTILIDLINVDRENRQRRELSDIESLAASIHEIGLINPIVIDKEYNLIAGERRYTACQSLGLSEIEVKFLEDLDDLTRYKIELEENVRRVDLTWQDHVAAVAKYHNLCKEADPNWSHEATANALSMSRQSVTGYLLVESMKDKELVASADKYSTAFNAATRIQSRAAAESTRDMSAEIDAMLAPPPAEPTELEDEVEVATPSFPFEIQNANFLEWAGTYEGPKFNFIHCDFPYGVGTGDKIGQSGAKVTGSYDDSFETYKQLLEMFTAFQHNFVHDSAHLMFWFSMDYYDYTITHFDNAGWRVNPFPLIWYKSNNKGIIPDAQRGPRRVYETALLASRGDRLIVRPKSNVCACPTDNELHQAQKPLPMLDHFFQMLCDEYTTILDPTCGSGNAIRAAAERGAESGLGLELNPEFAETAASNLALAAPKT